MIISVAYSIPVQRRSRRSNSSRVKPLIPQYTSWSGVSNHSARSGQQRDCRSQRCQKRHRPGATVPPPDGMPAALDQLVAVAQLLHEPRDLAEVVAVVRVAHHHEAAARALRCPLMSALPYPRSGTGTTTAPRPRAISTEASVLPLSATMISPKMPVRASPSCAFRMQDGEGVGLVEAG